jgi:hypothetical protein
MEETMTNDNILPIASELLSNLGINDFSDLIIRCLVNDKGNVEILVQKDTSENREQTFDNELTQEKKELIEEVLKMPRNLKLLLVAHLAKDLI